MPPRSLKHPAYPQEISSRRALLIDALNKALEVFCSQNEEHFDEVLANALRLTADAAGVDRILIDRCADTEDGPRAKHLYQWSRSNGGLVFEDPAPVPGDPSLSAWRNDLERGIPVNRRLSDMTAGESDFMNSSDIKSIFVAPIFTHGEFWGCVIFLDSEHDLCFDEDCIDLMLSLSRLCAIAVMSNGLEDYILHLKSEREKIYYDALTGIYNRRFFDENLDRIVKTLSRSGGFLSLMMIDIDNFKDYNDTYGHSAGDACLKTVADLLSKSITRADDFIVRYGGDEFAVVLPNTDEDGACLLAEKMLEIVRTQAIAHKKNSDSGIVAISIGVTTGRVDTSHTADDYLKRADELLYMSKQSGRNKSTFEPL